MEAALPPSSRGFHIGSLHSSQRRSHGASKEWTSGKRPDFNYLELAELMGKYPGLAIFRRFATLNAKNLLYLQAEIAELEDQLDLLERQDYDSTKESESKKFQWEARLLMTAPEGENQQWQKILEIRTKLKEYNDLLLQHCQLYRLPPANRHDLSQLRTWLEREDYGAFFLEIPEDCWDVRNDADLVALSERPAQGDSFSRFLSDVCIPWIHRHVLHRPHPRDPLEPGQTYVYSDQKLDRMAEIITMILASSLPTISILALHYIQSLPLRLVFIIVFASLFTFYLAIFTAASKAEIFVAAATLASVQVVFVGTVSG